MFGNRLKNLGTVCIVAGAVLVVAVSAGKADDTTDLRKLIEEQNKQIQELKQRLDKAETVDVKQEGDKPAAAPGTEAAKVDDSSVRKIVSDYLQEMDQAKRDAKIRADADGYGVGEDMGITARWNPLGGRGLTFETPAKDYIIHIGGRVNDDTVFFSQSDLSNPKFYGAGIHGVSPPGIPPAAQKSVGIGPYEDGTFFRRMRLTVDGQLSENFEFFTEYEFEQTNPHSIINLDECWVGIKNVPILQNVRVGHVKLQQGFESLSSSRVLTFFERSPLFDTFDEEFCNGLYTFQDFFDNHMTVHEQVYRSDAGQDGFNMGDGLYGGALRMSMLPIYEDQGRTLLHLGVSYTYRIRSNNDAGQALFPQNYNANSAIDFGTRISQRDAIGTSTDGLGTTGVGSKFVDTGNLNGRDQQVIGGELFFVRGPWSVQAEYMLGMVNDYQIPNTVGASAVTPTATIFTRANADPMFHGFYIQTGYFLTGENRYYDPRTGRCPGTYSSRILTPFWAVNDDSGHWNFGRGAWEVAFRYSYLNLDDKSVLGGKMQECTFGLNWFLTQNVQLRFQYDAADRYDLYPIGGPLATSKTLQTAAGATIGPNPGQPLNGIGDRAFPSWVNGFGMRWILDY